MQMLNSSRPRYFHFPLRGGLVAQWRVRGEISSLAGVVSTEGEEELLRGKI